MLRGAYVGCGLWVVGVGCWVVGCGLWVLGVGCAYVRACACVRVRACAYVRMRRRRRGLYLNARLPSSYASNGATHSK